MRTRYTTVGTILILAATADARQLAAGQAAQLQMAQLNDGGSTYEFNLVAGVWLPRLGGEVTLGPSSDSNEIVLETQFDLDELEAVPTFELGFRKDETWGLALTGFDFSTDTNTAFVGNEVFGDVTLNNGDLFRSSADMTSLAVEFSYWPACLKIATRGVESNAVNLWLSPGVSVRYLDIEQQVRLIDGIDAGASASGDGEWLVPMATLALELDYLLPDSFPIFEKFQIEGQLGVGPALGGDGGFVTQVRAGMSFFFCENIAFTFGYRLLDANVENDEYQFEGGLQGLFFGGEFEF